MLLLLLAGTARAQMPNAGQAAAAKKAATSGGGGVNLGPRPQQQQHLEAPQFPLTPSMAAFKARGLLLQGQFSAAAMTLRSATGADHGILGGMRNEIINQAMRVSHNKKASIPAAKDAIDAIRALGGDASHADQLLHRAAKKIGYHGRRLNMQAVTENVEFIANELGPNHPTSQKAIGQLFKYAKKTAWHTARQGSPPEAEQMIATARGAAQAMGESFDQGEADRIMNLANKRAVGGYVWQARLLAKKGEHGQAAALIAESLAITEKTGHRPGWFARRQLNKLMRQLGPEIAQAKQGRAQQLAAQEQAMMEAEQEELRAMQGGAAKDRREQGEAEGEAEERLERERPAQQDPLRRRLGVQAPGQTTPQQRRRQGVMPHPSEVVEPVGPNPFDPGPG